MDSLINPKELDIERLIGEWRWLIPDSVRLLAISTFGELVLQKNDGSVWYLDIHAGSIERVANTSNDLQKKMATTGFEQFLLKTKERELLASKGWKPAKDECFTYKMPVVFAEGDHDICTVNVYEAVGFLGNVHRQIKDLPEGAKVRFAIQGDH